MKVLDVCCKAGGTSMGYKLAGLEVTGVDIEEQPNFPFRFYLAEGVEFIRRHGSEYDLISVSPPCQRYSKSTEGLRKKGKEYPDLIGKFRQVLIEAGKPYVIENVPGAPLISPIFLNGAMFDLLVHRPRYFECSFPVIQPMMPFVPLPAQLGKPVREGDYIQPVGNFSGVEYAKKQMQINWMTKKELTQAIPPAYTKYIGEQFIAYTEGKTLVSLPTGSYVSYVLNK